MLENYYLKKDEKRCYLKKIENLNVQDKKENEKENIIFN